MPVNPELPPASLGQHAPLIEQSLPGWVTQATPQRREALKQSPASVPDWYRQASPAQRQALNDAAVASFTAQTQLDQAVATLQDIDSFAEPLLVKALQDQFNVRLDVHKTLLLLQKTVEMGVFRIELTHFEVLRLPLLQAALHNFEASEAESGAFHASSGFLQQTSLGQVEPISTTLTVTQFIGLCRSLDIGAQYQTYLKGFFYPTDSAIQSTLRNTFITAQKSALLAAAHLALLKKDIEPDDLSMIQAVVNGDNHPMLGGRPVWFHDMGLMKRRMTGCVAFVICEKYRYTDDLILYVPNDPHAALKRYTFDEMRAVFKQRLGVREASDPNDASPSAYQRFFSQFVAYADRPYYFSQFTEDAPGTLKSSKLAPFGSLINDVNKGLSPFSLFTGINELPPGPRPTRVPNTDPYVAAGTVLRQGAGIWEANVDLWDYLFDRHRDQLLADARSHAVPTADVDARVRSEKFSRLLNIGMLLFNGLSMLVPVLGEVMMVVMAGQLLYETFEGAIEWAEGDRRAAKAHLLDVAENIALLAVMAGAGKGLAKLTAVKPEPVIEALEPVVSADGKTRLWKPDLSTYESPVTLPEGARPNASGQFQVNGKTYIRQAGKVYETTFDEAAQRWRIQHPTDGRAYAPPLSHNGAGAWRHTLERPQTWDRLTLLRRMGHVTEAFNDEQLLSIADISGVGDAQLRKMHLDNAPPPAVLADTLRLFEADQRVARVIEQVETGQAVDEHYLYVLPLVTEMPRWPRGRVLQVFEGPQLTGASIKYGAERLYPGAPYKPPIRITRADVLGSQLPDRILAALDESEVTQLLGGEPARVRENRVQEFRKQITDHARTRQPALFESLCRGNASKDPQVTKLQRLYPGLGESGAEAVLADADAQQLADLRATGRVPLGLQEQARWHVQQNQLGHAIAGLHMENLASAASKRLALHTLARLPGWSDAVRLELREGHIGGPLLEAIGSNSATQRKYVVKSGPMFQAFNERGEALNSLPRQGDNFYASIMHALPDGSRQALGVPQVAQSAQLRRAIIDQAVRQRPESRAIVDGGTRKTRWFKPPQRISAQLIGYPASGGGQLRAPLLESRVRDVYPQLTDGQVNGFILRRMVAGDSEQQIFNLLGNRLREWQNLEGVLDQWVAEQAPQPRDEVFSQWNGRRQAAQAIKDCWRASPLAELPRFGGLNLFLDEPLPSLDADFSHVRSLSIGGRGISDINIERVLGYFAEVQELTVIVTHPQLRTVPAALAKVPKVSRLHIASNFAFDAEQTARLSTLTGLTELHLDGAVPPGHVLDVSQMQQLRDLKISRSYQAGLPAGVLDLPLLERLDLKGTAISSLPARLYEPGHERLWSGLSLDWSWFAREDFRQAYDYVRSQPMHLLDQEEMVSGYCKGQLQRLARLDSGGTYFPPLLGQAGELQPLFLQLWPDAAARWSAIEALTAQHDLFVQPLEAWVTNGVSMEVIQRNNMAGDLKRSWYQGLLKRYGARQYSTDLELPRVRISEFPPMPQQGFEHVQSLNFKGARLPAQTLPGFVSGFSGLRALNLGDCSLADLPLDAGDWAGLEHLDLSHNPLEGLDVGAMVHLRTLGLSHTSLSAWPLGWENLPVLEWLDLRGSHITQVPQGVLADDAAVLSTNLLGTPLTKAASSHWAAAMQRVELNQGLSAGTLERFGLEPVPERFPPQETGGSLTHHLLPLPPPQAASSSPQQRVLRLWPELQADELQRWATRMADEGGSEQQLHTRLDGWSGQFEALVRQLNGWLFTREAHGSTWVVNAQIRRQAALRIVDAWREGLCVRAVEPLRSLELEGLQLGDLPRLPDAFGHIETLNAAGVLLSETGSEGFFEAFPRVRTLVLNNNALSELPRGIAGMAYLERLELAGNLLAEGDGLCATLARYPNLQWLDVSQNQLDVFSVDGLPRLQTLDISSNRLEEWPDAVLQSSALRTLDLRNNNIESIPAEALDGTHDQLMEGVDLSDNIELSRDSLERLQAYAADTERPATLGLSRREIEELLDDNPQSDAEAVESDEELPEPPPVDEQVGGWLGSVPVDEQNLRRERWAQLLREPGNAAFFHLLERLQDTEEYRLARADLTHRVWRVMDAVNDDAELRGTVFAMSSTHGTCVDGRMLTFSNLEIKVFEHDALQRIDPTRLDQKGPALLKLARQLFRLDKVEALASQEASPGMDAAEVRLEYRIGLRAALDLPGQPAYMRFGRPLRGAEQSQALEAVRAAESSEAFYEYLINVDYWAAYLEEKYPAEFAELERVKSQKREALEIAHPQIDQQYAEAANMLDIELSTARNEKLIALSRREVAEQPGTSRDLA
ncbi:NEL-type E3 ubiquitin ligase domain-containing protein [Pseudomonas sp. SDO5271_S396]